MKLDESIGAALIGRSVERLRLPGAFRQCAFVRVNGPIFYAVAAASLLESTAPAFVERACDDFASHKAFCDWLRSTWLPEREARVIKLREYIAVTWPEFDWSAAKDQFRAATAGVVDNPSLILAQKALARCTAVAQSTLFYRCLARWTDDPQLRDLAAGMARQDEEAFARFREVFDAASKQHALGFRAEWRAIAVSVRAARDLHVQSAFDALVAQWGPNAPFSQTPYAEFTARVAAAAFEHLKLGWPERIFFKAWKQPPRPSMPAIRPRKTPGFRAVLPRASGNPSQRVPPPRWHA